MNVIVFGGGVALMTQRTGPRRQMEVCENKYKNVAGFMDWSLHDL